MRLHPRRVMTPRWSIALIVLFGIVLQAAPAAPTRAALRTQAPPTALETRPQAMRGLALLPQATSEVRTCDPVWLAALGPVPPRPQVSSGLERPATIQRDAFGPPTGSPHRIDVPVEAVLAPTGHGRPARAERPSNRTVPASRLDVADVAQSSALSRPNDEFRDFQTDSLGLVLHAFDAWQISYGRDDVTIAVISDGVDLTHPDLKNKIWRNRGEIPGNGIDDDRNGYVDDVHGWDFGREWNAPTKGDNEPQPIDFSARRIAKFGNRGTQMAGIAAAETDNGEGISGISWGARIMPLKATYAARDAKGNIGAAYWVKHIAESVCYAANNGASVILIGGLPVDQANGDEQRYGSIAKMSEAIGYAGSKGIAVIVPAGECGVIERADQRSGCPQVGVANPDIFPARSSNANLIAVTAMRLDDLGRFERRTTMSTGPWVAIAAPGEGFHAAINTVPGGTDAENEVEVPYQYIDASHQYFAPDDFAAAHVAGVAAVMKTINPTLSPLQIKEQLCRGAHRDETLGAFEVGDDGWLRNDVWGCGVLDFERTVEQMPHKIRLDSSRALHAFVPLDQTEIKHFIINPYLNVEAWTIYTESTWLEDRAQLQKRGNSSARGLAISVESLDRWANGLSSRSIIAPQEIRVCPMNDPDLPKALKFTQEDCGLNARHGCACLQLRVHVADRVHRIYLPRGLRNTDDGLDR